jgi:hypothetical protein
MTLSRRSVARRHERVPFWPTNLFEAAAGWWKVRSKQRRRVFGTWGDGRWRLASSADGTLPPKSPDSLVVARRG